AADARAAVPPGDRSKTVGIAAVPVWTSDHVVTVVQRCDEETQLILGVATDEAIALGDCARDARAAVAPSDRPPPAVPIATCNHVVAVALRDHALKRAPAHLIPRAAADEAIRLGEDAADRRITVAPGNRPSPAVPIPTCDHVVAVA